jgi:hypothetical protein
MCTFPVSGQPPTVIFCAQDITGAADRTTQQRLGVQQRPEAHGHATLAHGDRVCAVASGQAMPDWPEPRLDHLLSSTYQG